MSTLKATNIKNESSAGNNIVLDSGGGVAVNNGVTLGTGTTISSPASDTFAVSTNGSERIRVDSSGRFGVGTATITGFSDYTTVHLGSSSSGSALRLVASGDTPGTDDFVIYKNTSGSYLRSYGDPIVFYGNSSEYGRWDTSGRLLVGTDSARDSAAVQVSGANNLNLMYNVATASEPVLNFTKSRGVGSGDYTIVNNGDYLGSIYFRGADGSVDRIGASIHSIVDGTPGAGSMPTRLSFGTTPSGATYPTERMRITRDGRTSITSEENTWRALTVTNSANVSGNGGIHSYLGSNTNDTSSYHFIGSTGGPDRIYIYGNGNIVNQNNSYGSLSDSKLKENIVDAGSQWSDIKALQVRKYNFKEGQTHTQIGLIAQEVELVSPGLVTESPDRDEDGNALGTVTKSVNYSVLYMKAVKALQEAQERIETLEAKVAALEAQ